jgi:hypothetical protein
MATADAIPLPLGAPVSAPAPSASELGAELPIFEAVESDYFRTRDQDLPGPSEPQSAVGALTSAGLPRRIPQANRIPGAAADQETGQATPTEAAQIAVGRLASFQRGSRRARAVTRMDRDAQQSSQDD